MASDLLTIARSGTKAARVALDVTAQNIANASTDGYVRRSVSLAELTPSNSATRPGDVSLSGVRLDRIVRNADTFRQAEVRRTGADAARADTEVAGLENVEAAVEQANVYPSIVAYEASLQRLASDPVSSALRTAVVEDARTVANTLNIASNGLDAVGKGLRFDASDGVAQVNALGAELSRVNVRLSRVADAGSDRTALLDRRDLLLQQMSGYADVTTTIQADKSITVRLGGASGPALVNGGTTTAFAMTTAADGTIGFTLGATSVAPSGGSLAGAAQALVQLKDTRGALDDIAATLIGDVNDAQARGVALDGTTGQPMFSGAKASDIAVVLSSGAGIATAPAGAAAGSRDVANLSALRQALAASDPAGAMDALLFDISSTVAGRTLTRDALTSIASAASIALQEQAGVDLDQEAVNLVRYQQAFQASARVMQVATDTFDTLLRIG